MRAVLVSGPGQAAVTDLPDPTPGPGEVIVEVTACGLCGTDMHILGGELPSANYPLVPGHELTGRVVALAPDVTGPQVGTRVAVDPNMPCGACHFCRIGRANLCDDYRAVGVTQAGGFAELVAVPARCAYVLPDAAAR